MNLKKIGKVFRSKFVGTGPLSYKKKKNLPGRELTKVEKHWCRGYRPTRQSFHTNLVKSIYGLGVTTIYTFENYCLVGYDAV